MSAEHITAIREALGHVPKAGVFADRHETPWRATLRDEGLAALAALGVDLETATNALVRERLRMHEERQRAERAETELQAALEALRETSERLTNLEWMSAGECSRRDFAAAPARAVLVEGAPREGQGQVLGDAQSASGGEGA